MTVTWFSLYLLSSLKLSGVAGRDEDEMMEGSGGGLYKEPYRATKLVSVSNIKLD